MLVNPVISLTVLLAGFFTYVATHPAAFRYTRSLAMDAAADTLFAYIR